MCIDVKNNGRDVIRASHTWQGILETCFCIKWCWPPYSVFLLTSGDARGLGLRLSVCACAVGLGGNVLLWMRGTWGVVWRFAHVPTIPITWLRRINVWDWTAHASHLSPGSTRSLKLCEVCGSTSCVWCSCPHGVTWTTWSYLGACDVNLVTWAKCSFLIGSLKFCCAVIGQDLV